MFLVSYLLKDNEYSQDGTDDGNTIGTNPAAPSLNQIRHKYTELSESILNEVAKSKS